jgi:hypothetical protein
VKDLTSKLLKLSTERKEQIKENATKRNRNPSINTKVSSQTLGDPRKSQQNNTSQSLMSKYSHQHHMNQLKKSP